MPLGRVQSFSDPDDYCSSVRGMKFDLTVTETGRFASDLVRVDLQSVWMHRYSSNLAYVAHAATIKGRASFAFRVEEGPSLLRATEEMRTINIERMADGQATYTRASGAASWASMTLPVDVLAAVGAATAGSDFAPPVDSVSETPLAARMARLQRLHAATGHLARTAPEIIANPEAARGLEHELVQALVACLRPVNGEEDRVTSAAMHS